jgi:hypothetical protein
MGDGDVSRHTSKGVVVVAVEQRYAETDTVTWAVSTSSSGSSSSSADTEVEATAAPTMTLASGGNVTVTEGVCWSDVVVIILLIVGISITVEQGSFVLVVVCLDNGRGGGFSIPLIGWVSDCWMAVDWVKDKIVSLGRRIDGCRHDPVVDVVFGFCVTGRGGGGFSSTLVG